MQPLRGKKVVDFPKMRRPPEDLCTFRSISQESAGGDADGASQGSGRELASGGRLNIQGLARRAEGRAFFVEL